MSVSSVSEQSRNKDDVLPDKEFFEEKFAGVEETGCDGWFIGLRGTQSHRFSVVESMLPESINGPVLDIGCALGDMTSRLRKRYAQNEIQAIDISHKAVQAAMKRHPGIIFRQGQLPRLDFPSGYFDLIACLETIYYLSPEDLILALEEIDRTLRPGGYALFSVPRHSKLSPGFVVQDLESELSARFKVVSRERIYSSSFVHYWEMRLIGLYRRLLVKSQSSDSGRFMNYIYKGLAAGTCWALSTSSPPFTAIINWMNRVIWPRKSWTNIIWLVRPVSVKPVTRMEGEKESDNSV